MMRVEPILWGSGNYAYLVVCEATRQAALVDPGDAAATLAKVRADGVTPSQIWITHGHHHCFGGIEGLVQAFGPLTVVAHAGAPNRIPHQSRFIADNLPVEPLGLEAEPLHAQTEAPSWSPEAGTYVYPATATDQVVALGNLVCKVIPTPGHTRDAIAFHVGGALFVGDTLCGGGVNRNFEENVAVLMRSISEKIGRLPPETEIYPGREWSERSLAFAARVDRQNGRTQARLAETRRRIAHGEPTVPFTLKEERETNPWLRVHDRAVVEHVLGPDFGRNNGGAKHEPLAAFARLLEMRECSIGAPEAAETGPATPAPAPGWQESAPGQRYEYHLSWPRDWRSWHELSLLERMYALHDPSFWEVLTEDQRTNFLVEADWQEVRLVRGAPRESRLESLLSLEETGAYLGADPAEIYWLIATRKLPGWLVDGAWKFSRPQIDRYVEDFGGMDTVHHDFRQATAEATERRIS